MINVCYYARVSTEEEKQLNALKIQCEEAEDFIASKKEWLLVDKYIDEGISGTTISERDEFKRLMSDLYIDKFDIVIVKNEERIGRNSYASPAFLNSLILNGKQMYYYLDNRFFNPDEELLNSVKYGMAGQYSRDLSKKLNNSQKKRMEKGRIITNGRMWGYDQKDAQLFINEKEAEIVRFIFEQYVDGKGFRTIKNQLDEKGIKNLNGNSFALTTLKRIIKNEKYKGTLIMGKRHKDYNTKKINDVPKNEWVIHENAIPAIIDVESWERANEILVGKRKEFGLEDKRIIKGYFKGNYALSGKIYCGNCGRVYYHGKYNTMKYSLWECQGYREHGRKKENGCDSIRIPEYEMDTIVRQVIFDFWQNKDTYINEIMDIMKIALDSGNNESVINKLEAEKNKINMKKDKLFDLFSDDTISKKEYKLKNDTFNIDLDKIEEAINEQLNICKNIQDKQQRLELIKNSLSQDIKDVNFISDDLIKNLVEKVVVNSDYVISVFLNTNYSETYKKVDNKYVCVSNKGQD